MATRVAGAVLVLVGVANLGVGLASLVVQQADVSTLTGIGLALAGAATLVLARFVWRGHTRAVYGALVLFELLLVPRLVSLDDSSGPQLVSLVALVVVVLVLGIAAVAVRRRDRASAA